MTVDVVGLPDPTLVVTWPGAIVAVVLVFALVMWPGILAWLNSRAARRAAEDTAHQVNPNSGKSMRDSTNRTEVMISVLSSKFDDHVKAFEAHTAEARTRDARLDELERRRPRLRWRA